MAWIRPGLDALLALTESAAPAWTDVRHDPGLVLLLLRAPACRLERPSAALIDQLLQSPEPLELAFSCLGDHDLSTGAEALRVRGQCLRYAAAAAQVAEQTRRCDPLQAWIAGLLAPLDRLAQSESEAQTAHDLTGLGRRLACRWALPSWLSALIGRLGLPATVAAQLGADLGLFETVQQAAWLVQRDGQGLGLALPPTPTPAITVTLDHVQIPEPTEAVIPPPLLRRLLRLAADNRRLSQRAVVENLERDVDVLQRALEQRPEACEDRLRTLKLRALAEFAAGAGHEINNPLAVISGQAQYLLGHETDPARRRPMETIIGQTHRIHRLLRDVMQFARPSPPHRQPVTMGRLLDEVAESHQHLAEERRVRLERLSSGEEASVQVCADPAQLRSILSAVARNAIEAAGPEGWARLSLVTASGQAEVVVEDSGPGLNASQREHLFDPFYSGRSAGRGAGLGLSLAWALVRQHDGDIVLASGPDEPTRFVVRLPLAAAAPTALAG